MTSSSSTPTRTFRTSLTTSSRRTRLASTTRAKGFGRRLDRVPTRSSASSPYRVREWRGMGSSLRSNASTAVIFTLNPDSSGHVMEPTAISRWLT